MKTQRTTKALVIAAIFLLIGGSVAFAQGGWRHGGDGPEKRGWNGGSGRGDCPGWGRGRRGAGNSDLSEAEIAKLEEAREKFYTDTKDLRRQIKNLRVDIRDEIIKKTPDRDTVLEMQKTLSKMETKMDQKRIEHRLEMKKLVPKKGRGPGYGRKYGGGRGRGYGGGGGGGGNCCE